MSVLRRLDLDNHASLKNVMIALASELEKDSAKSQASSGPRAVLNSLENAWVNSILEAIDMNPEYTLLGRAITRFSSGRLGSSAQFCEAVQELEQLADEHVLTVPQSHIREYTTAFKSFEALSHSETELMAEEAQV